MYAKLLAHGFSNHVTLIGNFLNESVCNDLLEMIELKTVIFLPGNNVAWDRGTRHDVAAFT